VQLTKAFQTHVIGAAGP